MARVGRASARELLEVAPPLMRVIRNQMRRQTLPKLTGPQFQAPAYLSQHAGGGLSKVAEQMRLRRPAMSVLIEGGVNLKPAPDRKSVV